MFYERILKQQQKIQNQIKLIQKKLDTLPCGKLVCCHCGKYYKWYQSDGHTKTYIPKTNKTLAEQLAIKKYLSLTFSYLSREQTAISQYLKLHPDSNPAEKLLTDSPAYRELLTPYFTSNSQLISDWQSEPYNQNPHYPEQLIHKTSAGILVRSKAESMITTALHAQKIPFRYECLLQLDELSLYPDFTILHPKTQEIFYWEHFGLIDNPSYSKNTFSKLQLYVSHNIIPSINLITTYETKSNPLSSEMIEKIIEYYFL